MRSETNKDMDDNVYRLMGYDKKAKKVKLYLDFLAVHFIMYLQQKKLGYVKL